MVLIYPSASDRLPGECADGSLVLLEAAQGIRYFRRFSKANRTRLHNRLSSVRPQPQIDFWRRAQLCTSGANSIQPRFCVFAMDGAGFLHAAAAADIAAFHTALQCLEMLMQIMSGRCQRLSFAVRYWAVCIATVVSCDRRIFLADFPYHQQNANQAASLKCR